MSMFSPKKIPFLAATRLQRWAVLLSAYYYYDVQYDYTRQHSNADMLSCLPLATPFNIAVSSEPTIFNINQIHSLPVTSTELHQATRCDPISGHVF